MMLALIWVSLLPPVKRKQSVQLENVLNENTGLLKNDVKSIMNYHSYRSQNDGYSGTTIS